MLVSVITPFFSTGWMNRTLARQQLLSRTGEKMNSCVTFQTSPVWKTTCPLWQEPDNLSAVKGMNLNSGKNTSQLTPENWKYRLFHIGDGVPSWGNKMIPTLSRSRQEKKPHEWMMQRALWRQCWRSSAFGNGYEQLIPFVGLRLLGQYGRGWG